MKQILFSSVALLFCALVLWAGRATAGAQISVRQIPSLKAPEPNAAPPPSLVHKRYDREKKLTYLNVDIPRLERSSNRPATPGTAEQPWEIGLSFQLVYRGADATELLAAYLLVNSTGVERLAAIKQVSVEADGYQYEYERTDYRVEEISPPGSRAPSRQEQLVLKLQVEDVAQMANANRLYLRLGGMEFVARSFQLTGLRGALISNTAQ